MKKIIGLISLIFCITFVSFAVAQPTKKEIEVMNALKDVHSLEQAVSISAPYFVEMNDKNASYINYAFINWSRARMKAEELRLFTKTTTYDYVVKHPTLAKGSKVCVEGIISKLAINPADNFIMGTIMLSGVNKVVMFIDAGSNFLLYEGMFVNYCGITTGLKYYKNEQNAFERAVFVVGMVEF